MTTATSTPMFDKGLANTIAAESAMSFIDGTEGVLEYVGIDIDALARNSTFEEVTYLLWNRRLPTATELAALEKSIEHFLDLPGKVPDFIGADHTATALESMEAAPDFSQGVSVIHPGHPRGDRVLQRLENGFVLFQKNLPQLRIDRRGQFITAIGLPLKIRRLSGR